MYGHAGGYRFSRRLRADRRLVLSIALITLFVAPVALSVQQAHAVVTTNPASGTNYSTGFADQRKVFGTPTGLGQTTWWIFYSTGSVAKGIEYQYSFNGQTWSTPATLTTSGFMTYGWGFDAYQVGNNIFWVTSPLSGAKAVYFGEITLNPVTGGVTIVTSGTFNLANTVSGSTTSSITVDGNGYTWVAVYTGSFVELWAASRLRFPPAPQHPRTGWPRVRHPAPAPSRSTRTVAPISLRSSSLSTPVRRTIWLCSSSNPTLALHTAPSISTTWSAAVLPTSLGRAQTILPALSIRSMSSLQSYQVRRSTSRA